MHHLVTKRLPESINTQTNNAASDDNIDVQNTLNLNAKNQSNKFIYKTKIRVCK
jgi:hypothetical protein